MNKKDLKGSLAMASMVGIIYLAGLNTLSFMAARRDIEAGYSSGEIQSAVLFEKYEKTNPLGKFIILASDPGRQLAYLTE